MRCVGGLAGWVVGEGKGEEREEGKGGGRGEIDKKI